VNAVALAACLAVVIRKFVATSHTFVKALLTDAALPSQEFRQFHRIVRRSMLEKEPPIAVALLLARFTVTANYQTPNTRRAAYPETVHGVK